jgi:phage shock protein PspC (stress-responsive transcriptional regulator)
MIYIIRGVFFLAIKIFVLYIVFALILKKREGAQPLPSEKTFLDEM